MRISSPALHFTIAAVLLPLLAVRCGPATGGAAHPAPAAIIPDPEPGSPHVALFLCAGHSYAEDHHRPYLMDATEAGPALIRKIEATGRSVEVSNHADTLESYGSLLENLVRHAATRRRNGTWPRIVVVAYSHGAVWASAAARKLIDQVRIDLFCSLDGTSIQFESALGQAGKHGPAEEVRQAIGPVKNAVWRTSLTDPGTGLTDTIYPNVERYLEIRSADPLSIRTMLYADRTPNRPVGENSILVEHELLSTPDHHVSVRLPPDAPDQDEEVPIAVAVMARWIIERLP